MTHESDKRFDQVKHGDEGGEGAYPGNSGPQRAYTPQPEQFHTTTKSNTDNGSGSDNMRVVLPDEPPTLTPEAARALLRILHKAYAQRSTTNEQKFRSPEEEDDA